MHNIIPKITQYDPEVEVPPSETCNKQQVCY